MKKKLLSFVIAAMAITGTASAQESSRTIGTETKKGANILPAAGDFAIGIDAEPFLQYAGNFFNKEENYAPNFDGSRGGLFAKYFLTDKSAIRARFDFDFDKDTNIDQVSKLNGQNNEYVENSNIYKENEFNLALGYELRRGYGRLQGYYGGEVLVGTYSSIQSYKYGNPLQEGDWRQTKYVDQKYFSFGFAGFAGVEYFVAPKISLGAELGIRFNTDNSKDYNKITSESNENGVINTEEFYDNDLIKEKEIQFQTRTSGRINLTFHF